MLDMNKINDPYTKPDILATFQWVNSEVTNSFERIPAAQFFQTSAEGWSPAENLVHLIKSVSPVGKAMQAPKLLPAVMFGTSKLGSVRYAEIRERYVQKLANGGQATGAYVPSVEAAPAQPEQSKLNTLAKWREVSERLDGAVQSWSEADLDKYQLPHPLIGTITVREMLFFTLYHNLLHANEARMFLGENALEI